MHNRAHHDHHTGWGTPRADIGSHPQQARCSCAPHGGARAHGAHAQTQPTAAAVPRPADARVGRPQHAGGCCGRNVLVDVHLKAAVLSRVRHCIPEGPTAACQEGEIVSGG